MAKYLSFVNMLMVYVEFDRIFILFIINKLHVKSRHLSYDNRYSNLLTIGIHYRGNSIKIKKLIIVIIYLLIFMFT